MDRMHVEFKPTTGVWFDRILEQHASVHVTVTKEPEPLTHVWNPPDCIAAVAKKGKDFVRAT